MSLTDRASHFEFGENWRAYAKSIDQKRIDAAVDGVRKLFPEGLVGKSFLDIGCGSGLHSLAALSLGAASVTGMDIDENSVSTTRELLTKYAPAAKWSASIASVFDLSPEDTGTFDVVYSWGVLHHTGDMWRAIGKAATMVKPGGQFAIAIYNATRFDAFWRAEKQFYSRAPRLVQWGMRLIYKTAFLASQMWFRKSPLALIRDYSGARGMNFSHDLHDWLGGYPYETASVDEIKRRISTLGFSEQRSFIVPPGSGLFGSGCNEFVFLKAA